jgi:hypothetical protein
MPASEQKGRDPHKDLGQRLPDTDEATQIVSWKRKNRSPWWSTTEKENRKALSLQTEQEGKRGQQPEGTEEGKKGGAGEKRNGETIEVVTGRTI